MMLKLKQIDTVKNYKKKRWVYTNRKQIIFGYKYSTPGSILEYPSILQSTIIFEIILLLKNVQCVLSIVNFFLFNLN